MAIDASRVHRVTVTVGTVEIGAWSSYEITSSVIDPCDRFTLTRPVTDEVRAICRTDSRVVVAIDGVPMIDGLIDRTSWAAKAGTFTIAGRDKVGRLIQESIPVGVGVDGLALIEIVRKLAYPWFSKVSLSNARNRRVQRGSGTRAPAGTEPLILPGRGKAGQLDPGEMRWQVIEKLCAQAGLLVWSAADGTELIIGKPNYTQEAQFLFRHGTRGEARSNVRDLEIAKDISDCYAMIEVHGSGTGDDDDYGDGITSHLGIARDGANADGTGGLFQLPKRIALSQSAVRDKAEAERVAHIELVRRRFKAQTCVVEAATHGQILSRSKPTLFVPDTVARVQVDAEIKYDGMWWAHSCTYRGAREGETTQLEMVPVGTEVAQ